MGRPPPPPEFPDPARPGGGAAVPAWLDWLHEDADGTLGAEDRARLAAWPEADRVARWREALHGTQAALSSLPSPALPQSVARQVAGEVAASAQWRALPPPALPRSVAAAVAADVALAHTLQLAPAVLPRSVAAGVAGDVRVAGQVRPPAIPRSVAASVASEIAWQARLHRPVPAAPSVAAGLAARIAAEAAGAPAVRPLPAEVPPVATPVAALQAAVDATPPEAAHVWVHPVPSLRGPNPAPALLVGALMVGLLLLTVTTAWPNLTAGALVLQALLAQVSPLAVVGAALVLLTSVVVAWRPTPTLRTVGAGAYALAAVLTLPTLYQGAASGRVTFGQNVTVERPVDGNVIAIGGNVHLTGAARVDGEVVTLLGDVTRDPGAQVTGRVNTLLGQAPGDRTALQAPPPSDLSVASAAAFRPLLGWLGGAAWSKFFVLLTAGALGSLFTLGVAPVLARRQRHAPMRTLALGVLTLAALGVPALVLGLAGLLGPALLATMLLVLLLAVGLSVTAYDGGRALAVRARLPVPDVVGAVLGLTAIAASLGEPPLALLFTLVGGTWGAGTLLLTHRAAR